MIDRRKDGAGRRSSDRCVEEVADKLDEHIQDYRQIRSDVDRIHHAVYEMRDGKEVSIRDDLRDVLILLQRIDGGLRVVKFIGWLLTGGALVTIYHALQYVFAAVRVK